MRPGVVGCLLMFAAFTGCAPAPTMTPSSTPHAPTATASEATPEAILAPTRHAGLPESDIATHAPITQTVIADLATRTPTPTLTPGGPPTATADPRSDPAFDVSTDRFVSPDGRWVATSIVSFPHAEQIEKYPYYYYQLSVERVDGSARWVIAEEWEELSIGYDWPTFYRWSDKGESLYYTHRVVPDGCGPSFSNGWDLYHFDLKEGAAEEILPPYSGWSIALSPDEAIVAYTGHRGLTFRDVETREERVATLTADALGYPNAGAIHWAPDQSAVVMTLVSNACSLEPLHTIFRVDRATLRIAPLLEDTRQRLVTVGWPEMDRVLLREMQQGWGWTNQFYWMHPVTGEITARE